LAFWDVPPAAEPVAVVFADVAPICISEQAVSISSDKAAAPVNLMFTFPLAFEVVTFFAQLALGSQVWTFCINAMGITAMGCENLIESAWVFYFMLNG
jgi:hypothetical protein